MSPHAIYARQRTWPQFGEKLAGRSAEQGCHLLRDISGLFRSADSGDLDARRGHKALPARRSPMMSDRSFDSTSGKSFERRNEKRVRRRRYKQRREPL